MQLLSTQFRIPDNHHPPLGMFPYYMACRKSCCLCSGKKGRNVKRWTSLRIKVCEIVAYVGRGGTGPRPDYSGILKLPASDNKVFASDDWCAKLSHKKVLPTFQSPLTKGFFIFSAFNEKVKLLWLQKNVLSFRLRCIKYFAKSCLQTALPIWEMIGDPNCYPAPKRKTFS